VRLYDSIGATYTVPRRNEPRIAAQVWDALGDARTVLNVGAGTGSYEPPDRDVTAVEPPVAERNRDLVDLDAAELEVACLSPDPRVPERAEATLY
jgi:hypothetical protein